MVALVRFLSNFLLGLPSGVSFSHLLQRGPKKTLRRRTFWPSAVHAPAVTAIVILLLWPADASAPVKRPHFTDIAPRSQISYQTNNDYSPRKYFQQPMCGGVGVLDYDGDGRMDLFFTNGAKLPELKKTNASFYNCLLRNKGDGTFEDVTRKAGLDGRGMGYSYGVAVGDYDNDGRPDLF